MNLRNGLLVASIALALTACNDSDVAAPEAVAAPVDVKLIAINDFHGNIEATEGITLTSPDPKDPAKTIKTTVGGAEYLATWVKNLKAKNPNNVVVSAGDLIGASPMISALYHDEPTIESMNALGLEFNAVGNHEFDDGSAELLRMQNGGCHADKVGCADGKFDGAKFKFLAANVQDSKTGKTLFPAYLIKEFNGVKVGFIGMTLKGTPGIVTPSGIAGLDFKDEVETANKLVPELQKQGIETIVVLLHEGGITTDKKYNECNGISGPIVDIVNKLDKAIDVVISGHTHQPYNCKINDKLVTSAYQYGGMVTDIDLTIDPKTRNVTKMSANNLAVTRDVPKDAAQTSLIEKFQKLVSPLKDRVAGTIAGALTKTATKAGEMPLGRVIADAQLDATADKSTGASQISFMNPGGVRAELTPDAAGKVTYGQLFTVQPFGNTLVTMTLTGEQIDKVLEQQWNGAAVKIMQVSAGFSYTWDKSKPDGSKIDIASIKLNGVAIDPKASYRVTVNNFMATGGDGYLEFVNGKNVLGGPQDVDALENYLKKNPLLAVPNAERISVLN
ncbi:bifunctional metallophosphatase/5'-nucleotidase [Iodobacter sp. HSC-16F04]|uniref:Bifunctional metallophosphatase/5'-nucleotidase n=1 Tax=Iodobacter violaceini TaxID=3044271 RepID=A0ABX0KSW7_9NEIS|nr:bifunctional metallophosphatase/5'-nucleotidase [Iodobacter violacea]NHQ86946.1 bifunctional metallophosphatase/5'-nucleotidase [Iodobacter violacea]